MVRLSTAANASKPLCNSITGNLIVWVAAATLSLLAWNARADRPLSSETASPSPTKSANSVDSPAGETQSNNSEMERNIRTFIQSVVAFHNDADYALWPVPVCPFVAGISPQQKEFMFSHLSGIAQAAGVLPTPANCSPNLFIYFTSDPDALLVKLRHSDPRLFDTPNGLAPLNHFLNTARPIRVWYNDYIDSKVSGSRLVRDYIRLISNSIIVVDTKRIGNANLGQVSDYIALIGLAEVNLDSDLGNARTILRLFGAAGDEQIHGLTSWDRALLKSIYRTPPRDATRLSEMETAAIRYVEAESP
jgi:hypothetical protein